MEIGTFVFVECKCCRKVEHRNGIRVMFPFWVVQMLE